MMEEISKVKTTKARCRKGTRGNDGQALLFSGLAEVEYLSVTQKQDAVGFLIMVTSGDLESGALYLNSA